MQQNIQLAIMSAGIIFVRTDTTGTSNIHLICGEDRIFFAKIAI